MADTDDIRNIDRPTSKRVGALAGLLPFLAPYKLLVGATFLALLATASVSLVLPLAVRRVVDGFDAANAQLLDSYFAAAIGLAVALAIGSGLRFYLVTRLGERVVADIRKAVFRAHHLHESGVFRDHHDRRSGQPHHHRHDAGAIGHRIVGQSWFLRNMLLFFGGLALMIWTAPKLAALVLLAVPAVIIPIVFLGRRLRGLSRKNQDWIAASSGNASEALMAAQTVQAFTHEDASRNAFDELTEQSFETAKRRILTRAAMTSIVIFMVFSGIVAVLWSGAHDVRSATISIGVLIQFVIYSAIVAASVAALSEIWGEIQRAAGATERLGRAFES